MYKGTFKFAYLKTHWTRHHTFFICSRKCNILHVIFCHYGDNTATVTVEINKSKNILL